MKHVSILTFQGRTSLSYKGVNNINKKTVIFFTFSLLFLFVCPIYSNAEILTIQEQIDAAEPGDTIKLPSGNYNENIIITKSIHLIGDSSTIVSQDLSKPAITIDADDVIIKDIDIQHTTDDLTIPAMNLTGNHHLIKNTRISTSGGSGIVLQDANDNTLSLIEINGDKNKSLKERVHGIELWNAHNNHILDSHIQNVLDGIYIEKSNTNTLENNIVSHSRYGYHLMFTNNTTLKHNQSHKNISGMYIMGASGPLIENNDLQDNNRHPQSLGLFIFDTENATIKGNTMIDNRVGILIESAKNNLFSENNVQGNFVGIQFKQANSNEFHHNAFIANVVQGQTQDSFKNLTDNNFWSDHQGLDITGDGISDVAYQVEPFFLALTKEFPAFQLLFQAPGMIFLEKMITTPREERLIDHAPLMNNLLQEDNYSLSNPVRIFLFCLSLISYSIFIFYLGVKK